MATVLFIYVVVLYKGLIVMLHVEESIALYVHN